MGAQPITITIYFPTIRHEPKISIFILEAMPQKGYHLFKSMASKTVIHVVS